MKEGVVKFVCVFKLTRFNENTVASHKTHSRLPSYSAIKKDISKTPEMKGSVEKPRKTFFLPF